MESFQIFIIINAKPEELFYAWLDSNIHSTFTGSPAKIDPKVGGKFTAWDNYISGSNIELIKNKKIVQKWRTIEFNKVDEDSILEILFEDNKNGTKLILKHSHLPDGTSSEYKQGWKDYYFNPLKKYFKSLD